jgi:hypothetical protein
MAGDVEQLRAYVEYFRDMGIFEFYRRGEPVFVESAEIAGSTGDVVVEAVAEPRPAVVESAAVVEVSAPPVVSVKTSYVEPAIPKLVSFDDLKPLPESRVAAGEKAGALVAIQE